MGMGNFDLLTSGLKLLVFGIGMVYLFLVVTIFAINVMSVVLKPWMARFEPHPPTPAKTASGTDEINLISAAVAAAALRRLRI